MSIKHQIRDWIILTFCLLFSKNKARPIVLLYHSVIDDGHWLSVSPQLLEKQINYFLNNGFEFLDIKDLDNIKGKNKKSVCFTFDDGFENNYTNAVPILKKYNVPAVFFVVTNHIGVLNENQEFKCMNWEQLLDLSQDKLFTIGAHSETHRKFTELSNDEVGAEINNSKNILEKGLNQQINTFAFPYGRYRQENLVTLKEANIKYNFITRRKRWSDDDNLLEIPRFVVDKESYKFLPYMPYFGYEFYWKLYRLIFKR